MTLSLGISPADKTSLRHCLCAGGNNGRFIGVILFLLIAFMQAAEEESDPCAAAAARKGFAHSQQ